MFYPSFGARLVFDSKVYNIGLEQKFYIKKEITIMAPTSTSSIAGQFVDLVLRINTWSDTAELPDGDVAVLLETVRTAGFNAKAVVLGKLYGRYRSQDGDSTSETYPINCLCQYKVVGEDGDQCFATGWLDCAVRRVVYRNKEEEDREKIIGVISEQVDKSIPMEPIRLNEAGDWLIERNDYPVSLVDGLGYFVTHARDGDRLASCVGLHKGCRGYLDKIPSTDSEEALVCSNCHLRVLFPKDVKTYGQLREALMTQWTSTTV